MITNQGFNPKGFLRTLYHRLGVVGLKLFSDLSTKEKRVIREAVEPVFEKYRFLKKKEVIDEINEEQAAFCQKLEKVIAELPIKESFLIKERYLHPESDYITDYQVYSFRYEPQISDQTYARYRNRAMIRIALYLGVETGVNIKIRSDN